MMLILHRTYFEEGTNGALFFNNTFLGFTIELPWHDNERNISCIKEGTYTVKKRYSSKFKHHLQLIDVYNRKLILIHPGNDAKKDLRGCIAPVTQLSGIGKGALSRALHTKLISLCYQHLDLNNTLTLTIKS
ncbi:hypothetical protein F6U93_04390 [Tamlana haliotis]|uniref:DUF5675 domain-containing protein n=1 Tax=Pseudotamlana haliotis TaxID=2614804 RepID=A0A6N6MIU2_9FLAO|nr:DUF5675 family protein [Tamlana haliotis]KAB1068999.1 hypothetical protein F6U93_04390 [Tamlana haliotis]